MSSGWARARGDAPPIIHRKADDGAEAKGAEAEVSKPGDAAEKEADAVADHVAEGLHDGKKKQGDAKKQGGEGEAEEKEQGSAAQDGEDKVDAKEAAPQIGAKLEEGVIPLASAGGPLPMQVHHFLTDKHSEFTPLFEAIVTKYGLTLNDPWNLESLPHQGRHTTAYHNFVLAQVRKADREAKGDRKKFLALIETYVKAPVRAHPEMVRMK